VSERWELSVPLPASPHGGEGPGGCGDMAVVPALVPLAVDCIVVQGAVVLATAGAGLASANAPLPPWETFVAGVRREVLERIADLGQRRSGQPISPLPDQVAGADYAALAGQGLENGRGDRRPRMAWTGIAGFEDGRVAVLAVRARIVRLTDGGVLADRDVQYSAVVEAPTPKGGPTGNLLPPRAPSASRSRGRTPASQGASAGIPGTGKGDRGRGGAALVSASCSMRLRHRRRPGRS
jgi:hypothetical protein